MLLQAVEIGLNGLCILAFDKDKIREGLGLRYEPLMVLAIGRSAEKIEIVDVNEENDTAYYIIDGVHYVPKIVPEDLIL
jgi:nitroreductase